jgi:hypothetical protein
MYQHALILGADDMGGTYVRELPAKHDEPGRRLIVQKGCVEVGEEPRQALSLKPTYMRLSLLNLLVIAHCEANGVEHQAAFRDEVCEKGHERIGMRCHLLCLWKHAEFLAQVS